MKQRFYYRNVGDLQERLRRSVPMEEVHALHRIQPGRHLAIMVRHVIVFIACGWGLFVLENPWFWVPLAAFQGINILGFLILLHECVHDVVFDRPHPRCMKFLSWVYAAPSAISATQFDVWHNDHHRELGSDRDDPKRAHLTPRIVSRLYKALYFTPMLFMIYALAAKREARLYPVDTRRRIFRERSFNLLLHLGCVAALWSLGGWGAVIQVWLVPLFVFFPPAFIINRIGQHYDIEPDDVARWSTLVNGDALVRFLFLNSNHHIEHHYFPAVPLYNLPRLNRLLQPFFEENKVENRTYRQLLWGWFVRNSTPHTRWM